jgi:hypothetical protein
VAGDMLHGSGRMKIKIKTKIRCDGREYSGPNELPPDVRAAYDKATVSGTAQTKIMVNGQEFANQDEMPDDIRKLYDDVLSVIENNGEVTLPTTPRSEPLITKRQLEMILLLVASAIFGAWLFMAK